MNRLPKPPFPIGFPARLVRVLRLVQLSRSSHNCSKLVGPQKLIAIKRFSIVLNDLCGDLMTQVLLKFLRKMSFTTFKQ
uniref:Uncharacterized protein n=1 Tax=Tetranychus urticae TaxID=32264 RepID=T1K428_TETUR